MPCHSPWCTAHSGSTFHLSSGPPQPLDLTWEACEGDAPQTQQGSKNIDAMSFWSTFRRGLDRLLTVNQDILKEEERQMEEIGIKDTKEALIGVNELTVFFADRFSDGVQLADFEAFWGKLLTDPEFKSKIQNAYEGYAQIPAEAKDISLSEALELVKVQIGYVPKLVEVFTKKPVVFVMPEELKPSDT